MNKSGQSLIEVIIAIAVGAIFISAATTAIVFVLRSNFDVRTNQIAVFLAQEYLDNVSSIAESNWLKVYNPPAAKGANSQFYLDILRYAYVADYTPSAGLQIINISNPSAPTLAGNYMTGGYTVGIYVSGDYAYVATDYYSRLRIVNISNPSAPTLVGIYTTPGGARDVYVSGDYAYVADDDSGLQIINISNPSSPTLAGTYDTPGLSGGVYVSGNYAYVADSESGLQIINISNPSAPTLAGTYDTTFARGVYVSGNYAYVADDYTGLQIINISNPSAPTLAGIYNTTGYAYGVYVSGNYAYVADYFMGLRIINISNPSIPTLTGTYYTSLARGVYVSGNYAYVADDGSGLRIINISNPSAPTLAGIYDTPGSARRVYVLDPNNYSIISGTSTSNIEGKVFTRYFSIENVNREQCGVGNITSNTTTISCPTGFPGSSSDIAEDPSTQKITAIVEWEGGRKISLTKYLTRSRNIIFRQTDWSGGPGQESFATTTEGLIINNKFATSTDIDYTSSTGAIIIGGVPPVTGTLTSSVFDTQITGGTAINTIIWQGDLPSGTIVKFQIASTSTIPASWTSYIGPDGSNTTFYGPANPGAPIKINPAYHNNHRYFRYKVFLESDVFQTQTPKVNDMIINWSP